MKYFLIEIVLYIRRVLIVGEISIYFLRQKYLSEYKCSIL